MVKVMAVNAGSSSLKFQLINMPSEEVITSGLVERIGQEVGNFVIKVNGEKIQTQTPIPDHQVAVDLLLNALVDHHIVESLEEIDAVGHRVVHGGEDFDDSVVVDEEAVKSIVPVEANGYDYVSEPKTQGELKKKKDNSNNNSSRIS